MNDQTTDGSRGECRFCRSLDVSVVYKQHVWSVCECRACGHYSTIPWPSDADLREAYRLNYFAEYGMWSAEPAKRREMIAAQAMRLQHLSRYATPPGRLIEIGAAGGTLLCAAAEQGWEARGYDPSIEAVRVGRESFACDLKLGFIEDALVDAPADVLVAYHVLEHTPDPADFVRHAWEILKPGGLFVLEVPHVRAFDARWSRRIRDQVLDVPRHLCHFTPATLQRLVKASGFTVLQINGTTSVLAHQIRAWFRRSTAQKGMNIPVGNVDSRFRSLMRQWLSGYAFCLYARKAHLSDGR